MAFDIDRLVPASQCSYPALPWSRAAERLIA
jgi:hypothetical protein